VAPRVARLIDLFAGCGGISRGFVSEKFRVVGAVESDLAAASTYAANFGEDVTYVGDIADYKSVPRADVVVGGPPCQGFSNLGRRDPNDHRNRLWSEFVRVVVASRCEVFVLENVDRFAKSAEHAMLRRETSARGRLRGFRLATYALNAADFATPQRRIRTIIIGSRIGPVPPPDQTRHRHPGRGQKRWRTVSDAIFGMPESPDVHLPDDKGYFFDEMVPGPFTLDAIHVGRTYQPKSKERYACIPAGGSRFDLPDNLKYECWKSHNSGAADVLGRLEWDKPSVTIRTEFFKPEKGRYLHPTFDRALTHSEAARLQGFDDAHVWCGNKIEIARQIGNAVPPPLASAVARTIRPVLWHHWYPPA
jgi:DNA (cytosine-5)-methyltransferase 1